MQLEMDVHLLLPAFEISHQFENHKSILSADLLPFLMVSRSQLQIVLLLQKHLRVPLSLHLLYRLRYRQGLRMHYLFATLCSSTPIQHLYFSKNLHSLLGFLHPEHQFLKYLTPGILESINLFLILQNNLPQQSTYPQRN